MPARDHAGVHPRRSGRIAAAAAAAALAAGLSGCGGTATATPGQPAEVPRPSHVVIVMEENHGFANIIGSPQAPYINSLAAQGALFTDSSAVAHPSTPNYLALFSGSTHGITDDHCPRTFAGDNLGSQLAAAGQSFTGYAEGLPHPGYLGCTAGEYARRHTPWTDFTAVPATASQPFTAFPQDYSSLPAVSMVIPNVLDDMHDGGVGTADTWLQQNLDGYAHWAKAHNSLLILSWDEDDDKHANRIPTIFVGAHIRPGQYSEPIDPYRLLRTIEAAYGLPPLGHAADTQPITDIWTTGPAPASP